jgi:hypothetical protein
VKPSSVMKLLSMSSRSFQAARETSMVTRKKKTEVQAP